MAVLAVWFGCLGPYLASRRQRLIPAPLGKLPGWSAFFLFQATAWLALATLDDPVTAGLTVLVLMMCMWPGTVLAAAYLGGRPVLLCSLAAGLFSAIALPGGA